MPRKKLTELQKLAKNDWEIELAQKELFKRDWEQRFLDAETKEEFIEIKKELRLACGFDKNGHLYELPGSMEVAVLLLWSKFYKEEK